MHCIMSFHSSLCRNWKHLSKKTTLNICKHTLSDACYRVSLKPCFPEQVSNVGIHYILKGEKLSGWDSCGDKL